jgi:hypothetical protein
MNVLYSLQWFTVPLQAKKLRALLLPQFIVWLGMNSTSEKTGSGCWLWFNVNQEKNRFLGNYF